MTTVSYCDLKKEYTVSSLRNQWFMVQEKIPTESGFGSKMMIATISSDPLSNNDSTDRVIVIKENSRPVRYEWCQFLEKYYILYILDHIQVVAE